MAGLSWENVARARSAAAEFLTRPAALACLPAASLAVYWVGGDSALIAAAAIVPMIYLMAFGPAGAKMDRPTTMQNGLTDKSVFEELAAERFKEGRETSLTSALFKIEIDEAADFADRFGQVATDTIMARAGERIFAALREGDIVARTGDYRFSACLKPVRQLDLELCIQLAGRLQAKLEEPISIDGTTVYLTSSVGFCQLGQVVNTSPRAWIEATATALREAQAHGPNAIRAYSSEMKRRSETRAEVRQEVASALESGHIRPWFQPQISTDTGRVTGFEALARWDHPERGMISPADFLPAIEQADMLERLAEVMMYHAFAALKAWDDAGVIVPQIGVNFAGPELKNPRLVDKVKWELDRFDLTPERLAVEVLETVVARAPDDIITRNINGLGQLGCRIDLDDFGTGHASIASIRRFSVSRIKIDRSFVMKADRDPDQQRMISAILTMAERLGVQTLAEGVETAGEHALLAQLGCDHVQGFGIAKPMPFEETIDWMAQHNAKLQDVPRIFGNRTG
ncbi:putative bifunctional diguanylate cyclase/phosphodiesterase [Roseobacter sinensis]|uniref:Bifunctional diguanylate cyclase/phosphodiesterase n=1 Tax=Roseobacter sinensis TaxID=2931391 RepID=A0ABT3BJF2_9RHOB|nr:bifunctional diguanylate cyclase/phosphodiesterase [Roseobacter sp. WL0113]MCV3273705.1 bifunctional diguanylate cyclase/phosphodiesterase [Roseobacter sp. WL0113]